MTNLQVRSLVALFGIPLIILTSIGGGLYFFALVALASAIGLQEFYALSKGKGASPQSGVGVIFGLLLNLAFMAQRVNHVLALELERWGLAIPLPTSMQALMILFLLFIFTVLIIELFRKKPSPVLNVATTVLGVSYVSLFFGSLIGLREIFVPQEFPVSSHFPMLGLSYPQQVVDTIDRWGGWTIVTVFASIWVCDSAAYFAGRAIGKHRLFERISPNKTWEGALSGFFAAILMFLLAKHFVLPYLEWGHALVCGVLIGAFGQLGDLVESMMKRDSGVKDSSSLIPGHGGVLDRFDSILLVAPLLYLYFDFVVFAK